MTWVLLLFFIGVVLLATDVFLSSFVVGILGGVAMIGGCALAYREYGVMGASIGSVVALVLLCATIYVEVIVLPKTKVGRDLVVQSTAGSTSQPPLANAQEIVGKNAEAITTLAPSGYVLVAGTRYEAFSQSGHIAKGSALRVVGVDNFRLIVSKA